jgi:lysozyme
MRALGLASLGVLLGAAVLVAVRGASVSRNVSAFMALIRRVESEDDYGVIAGGVRFDDFSEHPFVVQWDRARPIGTTASGAYQMVRGTWMLARDNLGLTDFSPASQDAAADWLLKYKVPGQNAVRPEGTGIYGLIEAGRFDEAMAALRLEWEAFDRMLNGRYHVSLNQARDFLRAAGGVTAA